MWSIRENCIITTAMEKIKSLLKYVSQHLFNDLKLITITRKADELTNVPKYTLFLPLPLIKKIERKKRERTVHFGTYCDSSNT